jgi:hypothetical protein
MVSFTALFPKLHPGSFQITSPPDPIYNCIAWAAEDPNEWWWPLANPSEGHWPGGVPRERTLNAFRAAFATLGYTETLGEELEVGFQKIALFADASGIPTHAARQLMNGRWTSKLGQAEDIEHDLHDLEGDIYGMVVVIMKRPTARAVGSAE